MKNYVIGTLFIVFALNFGLSYRMNLTLFSQMAYQIVQYIWINWCNLLKLIGKLNCPNFELSWTRQSLLILIFIIFKINKWILFILFSSSNYAHARVINVNDVVLDFTISDFCVLSTLGMWLAVPIVIFLALFVIGLIRAILGRLFSR